MFKSDAKLDVSGFNCPVPLMQTKKALLDIHPGQVLKVTTTTSDSVHEFNLFSKKFEHELLQSTEEEGKFHFYLRKGQANLTEDVA